MVLFAESGKLPHYVLYHIKDKKKVHTVNNTFIQNGGSAVQGEGCTEVTSSIGIEY